MERGAGIERLMVGCIGSPDSYREMEERNELLFGIGMRELIEITGSFEPGIRLWICVSGCFGYGGAGRNPSPNEQF